MKPVDQTKLLERDGVGDCCRAAVATLLDMPLEKIPEFELFAHEQHIAVVSFIESLDYEYVGCLSIDDTNQHLLDRHVGIKGYHYASGKSPRSEEIRHAVVINRKGEIVHDPHPSRNGVLGTMDVLLFQPFK